MAAFVRWVANPEAQLEDNLRRGYELLGSGFRLV
jgi:hypothetical protein